MRDESQPSRQGPGYVAEDAALGSAGEPHGRSDEAREESAQGQTPTPEELDARDERFGPRKPMGPTAGVAPETVPEDLSETETPSEPDEPPSRRRRGGK